MATLVFWLRGHPPVIVIRNDLIRYLFGRGQ